MEKETIDILDNLKEVCENLLKKVAEMEKETIDMQEKFTIKIHQLEVSQAMGCNYPLELAIKDVKEGVAK